MMSGSGRHRRPLNCLAHNTSPKALNDTYGCNRLQRVSLGRCTSQRHAANSRSSRLARRRWPRPLDGCCADQSGQPGFNRQWHTTPVRHPQFLLHVARHSHDRLALKGWSRAHTGHDEKHVCPQRASGHVLDEVSVSGCNDEVCRRLKKAEKLKFGQK